MAMKGYICAVMLLLTVCQGGALAVESADARPYTCISAEYPPDLRAFSSRYGLFRSQADKEVKGYHELLRLLLSAISRKELLSEDDVDFEYSLGDIEDELQWANGIISQQGAPLAQQRVENKILDLAQSNAFVALTLARAWATWSGSSDVFLEGG